MIKGIIYDQLVQLSKVLIEVYEYKSMRSKGLPQEVTVPKERSLFQIENVFSRTEFEINSTLKICTQSQSIIVSVKFKIK